VTDACPTLISSANDIYPHPLYSPPHSLSGIIGTNPEIYPFISNAAEFLIIMIAGVYLIKRQTVVFISIYYKYRLYY
jgi:hypothetical protein